MPNKIDELFASDRLRKNWQKVKGREGGPLAGEREEKSPFEIFEHLRNLIRTKFAGDDAQALAFLLDDLHVILTRMFPAAGESRNQAALQEDMVPEFHDILNRIEDLVDAYEIARKRERK